MLQFDVEISEYPSNDADRAVVAAEEKTAHATTMLEMHSRLRQVTEVSKSAHQRPGAAALRKASDKFWVEQGLWPWVKGTYDIYGFSR